MSRPRRDAGRGGRWEMSPSPEPQQPRPPSYCTDLEVPTLRPRRRNTRPGLVSVAGPQAARPTSHPPRTFVPPGLTIITPDMPPARLSDMPPTGTRASRARAALTQPQSRSLASAIRRSELVPRLSSSSSTPAAQPAQHPVPHSIPRERYPLLSSLASAPTAQPAQPAQHPIPHYIPRERLPPSSSLSSAPAAQPAQPAQHPVPHSIPPETHPRLSSLASMSFLEMLSSPTSLLLRAQHPMPDSYKSVGVQVNLARPSATRGRRESRRAVTATSQRAPWRAPRASTPSRHVRKKVTAGHVSDTALNQPEATITLPDAATNAPATAPIHEFICLYSHDIRRKRKRWQDGILKLHTFNQKFMVYDEKEVYVGEGHWQGGVDQLKEGLEIMLDRPMAWVQIIEHTETKEQDLSQVLGKRAREVEERRAIRNVRSAPAAPIQLMPLKITGAWSKHAEDLLGRGRPIRR